MTRITHWEHADLLEYLKDRSYEWDSSDDRIWLKSSADGDAQMALQITPPASSGPHRLFGVSCIPQKWDVNQSDEYLLRVLDKYTGYGARGQIQQFLAAELSLETMTAYAVAIGIARIINDPIAPPEEAGIQDELFESGNQILPPQATDRMEKVYLLAGGGYVKLSLRGGMLLSELSAPSETSGGFSHPLRGIVRPKFGTPRAAAEHLFGWARRVHHDGLAAEQQRLKEAIE
jgi:hypothetical protein